METKRKRIVREKTEPAPKPPETAQIPPQIQKAAQHTPKARKPFKRNVKGKKRKPDFVQPPRARFPIMNMIITRARAGAFKLGKRLRKKDLGAFHAYITLFVENESGLKLYAKDGMKMYAVAFPKEAKAAALRSYLGIISAIVYARNNGHLMLVQRNFFISNKRKRANEKIHVKRLHERHIESL